MLSLTADFGPGRDPDLLAVVLMVDVVSAILSPHEVGAKGVRGFSFGTHF